MTRFMRPLAFGKAVIVAEECGAEADIADWASAIVFVNAKDPTATQAGNVSARVGGDGPSTSRHDSGKIEGSGQGATYSERAAAALAVEIKRALADPAAAAAHARKAQALFRDRPMAASLRRPWEKFVHGACPASWPGRQE